jgi:hypothetical protein
VSLTWNLIFMSLWRRAKVLGRLRKVHKKNEAAEQNGVPLPPRRQGLPFAYEPCEKTQLRTCVSSSRAKSIQAIRRSCNDGASKSHTNRSLWLEVITRSPCAFARESFNGQGCRPLTPLRWPPIQ